MKRSGTLITVKEWDDRHMTIVLTHRPWWRRIPFIHRPREETLILVGLSDAWKEANG